MAASTASSSATPAATAVRMVLLHEASSRLTLAEYYRFAAEHLPDWQRVE